MNLFGTTQKRCDNRGEVCDSQGQYWLEQLYIIRDGRLKNEIIFNNPLAGLNRSKNYKQEKHSVTCVLWIRKIYSKFIRYKFVYDRDIEFWIRGSFVWRQICQCAFRFPPKKKGLGKKDQVCAYGARKVKRHTRAGIIRIFQASNK